VVFEHYNIGLKDSLSCFKLALNNVHLDLSDIDSNKARNQMIIIGTSIIGIFVALMIGVFSSFHPVRLALLIRTIPLTP
jgi:hypothetical protein